MDTQGERATIFETLSTIPATIIAYFFNLRNMMEFYLHPGEPEDYVADDQEDGIDEYREANPDFRAATEALWEKEFAGRVDALAEKIAELRSYEYDRDDLYLEYEERVRELYEQAHQ